MMREEALLSLALQSGAVKAALWGMGRKPGLYSMADVLGLAPRG